MITITVEFIYSSFSHGSPYGVESTHKKTVNFTRETEWEAQADANAFFADWRETGFYAPPGTGNENSGILIPYHNLKSVFVNPPSE